MAMRAARRRVTSWGGRNSFEIRMRRLASGTARMPEPHFRRIGEPWPRRPRYLIPRRWPPPDQLAGALGSSLQYPLSVRYHTDGS